MPLTISQLEARLLFNLRNDTQFTTSLLDTYLTLCQERMVRDSPHTLGIKRSTVSIVAADQQALVASDVFQIIAVWLPAMSSRLTYVPHRRFVEDYELLTTIPSGAPHSYTVSNYDESVSKWNIRFDTQADASYTLTYWYYWMPAAISGTTAVPAISGIGFGELLIWAATMVARETNDPDGMAVAKMHYDTGMLEYSTYIPARPDWDVDQLPYAGPEKGMFPLDPAHFEN